MKFKSTEDTEISLEEALDGVDVIEVGVEESKGGFMKPHDPLLKTKAFEMYMNHVKYESISLELGVKKTTISSWATRERWAEARRKNEDSILKDDLETKKFLLSQLSKEILENCLKGVRKAGGIDGFKPKELIQFMSALGSVEKLSRLSLGMATSISEERSKRANFTLPLEHLKNVQQVKVADPFATKELNESTSDPDPNGTSADT